jgi:hypothetical protein
MTNIKITSLRRRIDHEGFLLFFKFCIWRTCTWRERFKLLLQVRCREMKEPERLKEDRRSHVASAKSEHRITVIMTKRSYSQSFTRDDDLAVSG